MSATLLVLAVAVAAPGQVLESDIGTGRFRAALPELFRALRADAEDPQTNASIGVVMSRGGLYASAEEYLLAGQGSARWEQSGLQSLAEVQSGQGRGQDAWETRQLLLSPERADAAEMLTYSLGAQDLLSAGDYAGAYELSLMALTVGPNASMAQATHALVLMELGELDEAGAFLWQAQLLSTDALIVRRAAARLALLEGDPIAAEMALTGAVGTRRQRHVARLRSDALVAQGRLYDALGLLDLPALRLTQQPDVFTARATLLHQLGYDHEALIACSEAVVLFPQSAYVHAMLEQLGDAACD